MAEVGIIASILQIADTGLRLSLKLYTFGEIVSTADRSVISISKDVSLTSSVLKELGQILIQDEKSRICSENAVQTADDIVKECLGVFEEMERVLVKKLPHLGTHDGEKAKRATVLLERLRWPYLQPKLELMRSNLERLKSTLNLMLNVISLARQQADRKESPEIIAGQRTLIEDLARSNDDYVRKFEQMKLSIDSARSVQSEGYDTSTTTLLSNSPDTRSIGDGPLLNAALKSSHAEPKLAGFTTAKVAPGQYSADFLGLLLEHYHTLMGKLLQELHAPEYQIPIESRSRIREDIIGTHTREIERAKTGHGYGQSHELLHSQRLTHQRLPGIQDTSGFLPPSTASDTQPLGRQSQQRESQATSTSAAIAHCYDRNYTVRHDREARRAELQAYWGRSRSGSQSALSHNERAHDAPSGATEDLDLIEYGDIPIKYDNVVHDHYSSPIIQRGYHISVQATIIPTAATGGEEQAQPQQQHQQMTAPQMAQQTTSPEADNATMGNVCRVHHSRLPSISAPHDSPDFRRQTEHQRVIQQQQQPQRTLVRKNAWKLSLQQAQQNISTKFGQGQHASAHAPQESFQEGLARKRSVPRRRQLTQGDQSALIPPLEIRGVNAEGEIALPKSKLKRDAVRGSESMSGGTSAEPTRSPTRNTEAMIGPSSPLNLQQSPQKLSPIQPHDLFTQANNDLPNKRKRWRSHRVGEDTMAIADSKQASQSTPTGSYQFESKPRESQHSMSSNSDTTRGSGDHNSDRKPPSDFLNKEGMAGNSTNEIEHLEVEQGDLRPARASMTYNESPASSSKSYPLSYHDSSYPSSSPLYSSYSSKIGNREEKSYPEPVVVEPPKIPQCWDQGCNGRRFSVFSNLLRHQREMSKIESKPICDSCGAQFTRQTARDNHAACDSCRNRLELEEASRIARSDGPLRSYVTTAVRKCRGRLAKREPPLLEAKGRNSLEQITQGKAQPGAKEHGDLEVSNQRETRSRPRVSQFVGEAVQTTPSPAPVSKDGDSDAKRDTRDTCEDAHESVAGTGGEQVPEDTSWLSTTDNELDDTDMEMQMDFDLDDGHVLDPLCSFNSSLGVDHDQVTIRNFEASSQNQSPKRRKVSAEPPINDNSQSQDEPQHIPPRASNGEGDIPETQDGRSVVDELLAQWTLSPTREVIN